MGDSRIRKIRNAQDQNQFYHQILRDLEAFERMLANNLIEKRGDRIGVEQEMCLVDAAAQPKMVATEILSDIDNVHFTHELGLYNLEINIDPVLLAPDGLNEIAANLKTYLDLATKKARSHDALLFLTGILPTIQARHLHLDFMTPLDRYWVINDLLLERRGSDFEIYLQGVDDFNVTLDSDLFEACNTSFQCHLQINPDEFVQQHNWAQMISGPVLACCTNSPLLFGRELWSETRIALFKQSLDTRSSHDFTRIHTARVHFGSDWIHRSPAELWRDGVTRFPLLFQGESAEDAIDVLEKGEIPALKSLQLHSGTTYTWNRLCYGVNDGVAHTRIECRYLPAGPTAVDQMANLTFWIGLMKGQPDSLFNFWKEVDFRVAKDNFIRGARTGINTVFSWFGKSISAKNLILDLLIPMAATGLSKAGVSQESIEKNLGIIEARVKSGQTGSEWLVQNSRRLRKKYQPAFFNQILVKKSLQYQHENTPVHEWGPIKDITAFSEKMDQVEHVMNADIKVIYHDINVALAKKIMGWQGIHHLPVENRQNETVGLLCWEDIMSASDHTSVSLVMRSPLISIKPGNSLTDAQELMLRHDIQALAVVEEGRLVGIITTSDLLSAESTA